MNNLLKQRLWQISFQYDFDKLYQVFKSTLKLKKLGQTDRMNDRMTTEVLKTRPRVGAASPIIQLKKGGVWLARLSVSHYRVLT